MRDILKYLKTHIKEDFRLSIYVYFIVFLSISIILNYHFDFEDSVLDSFLGSWKAVFYYFLFYAFAYFMVALLVFLLSGKRNVFLSAEFWVKSLSFLLLISLAAGSQFQNHVSAFFEKAHEQYFAFKIFVNLKRFAFYVIPLLIIKVIYDRKSRDLYGLTFRNFNPRPYLFMLLFMLPLITIASFNRGFLESYPTLKSFFLEPVFGLNRVQMTLLYELFYGFDFIFVELIFRGALVIGMARLLGKDAILPMTATYCFLHFGKPPGEAVSSVFGGYILGVIALYSRTILGGCLIHIGVAFLMELAAFGQYYFFGRYGF
jgi:hypothetical protein